jgi:electron transfer flavoprotein alpha subunit
MARPDPDYSRKGEIIEQSVQLTEEDLMLRIVERIKTEKGNNLKSARIIVAGGMGVGTKDNFEIIHALARTLGGEVGATRAAVDAGFIDREYQIGQTGVTVRPNLYIACGISGAIQHRAGMEQSKRIIAINTDPQAPIFSVAHYGMVGDLHEAIPKMIKAYKENA